MLDTDATHDLSTEQKLKTLALAVLDIEAEAIAGLKPQINDNFVQACRFMLDCTGRIVVLGMGKSGHIGGKIAATLASTGTPAFFVHPGEASHGDIGMITENDVVIALSYSGKTDEILTLLPLIKRLNIPLISLTGNPNSALAKAATTHINVRIEKEACPLGLAPTTSTTAMLALGDALAIALLDARGFTVEDFAFSHPGGNLGRRLLLHVNDLMHTGDEIPTVTSDKMLSHALMVMSEKGMGMTAVLNQQGAVIGIYTDGDLRRTLNKNIDIHNTLISDVMTTQFKTATSTMLAVEALQRMETYKITSLLVLNDERQLSGVIHMHDLLQAKVV